MRIKDCTKEQFKLINDLSPVVLEMNYGDLTVSYFINQQPIISIKVIYKFHGGECIKTYHYIDLTEVYNTPLIKINTHILDPEQQKTIKKEFIVKIVNTALNDEYMTMLPQFDLEYEAIKNF